MRTRIRISALAKSMRRSGAVVVLGILAALTFGGCPRPYNPSIEPDDFVEGITNPYLQFSPDKTYIYTAETEDGTEEVRVTATGETKVILGVTCTVVHDTVTLDEELVEDTFDWYAQDEEGNVWYFGEDSKRYENGQFVDNEGSWEAGVDGAKPGIVMLAHPRVGREYRQEYAPDVAEDMAEVVGLHETVTVPYGTFTDCLKTREFTPLEPDVEEFKYYAPGVGQLLTEAEDEREELTGIEVEIR